MPIDIEMTTHKIESALLAEIPHWACGDYSLIREVRQPTNVADMGFYFPLLEALTLVVLQ